MRSHQPQDPCILPVHFLWCQNRVTAGLPQTQTWQPHSTSPSWQDEWGEMQELRLVDRTAR